MAKIADQYLEAHGRHLFGPGRKSAPTDKSDENKRPLAERVTQIQCYRCGSRGHRAVNCSALKTKRCLAVESKATKHGTVDLTVQSHPHRVMQVSLNLKGS